MIEVNVTNTNESVHINISKAEKSGSGYSKEYVAELQDTIKKLDKVLMYTTAFADDSLKDVIRELRKQNGVLYILRSLVEPHDNAS